MAAPNVLDMLPIGLRLFGQREEIGRIISLVMPAWRALQPNLPEIVERGKRVAMAIDPGLVTDFTSGDKLRILSNSWLQESLNKLGEKLKVDGVYGRATQEAVKRFETRHGLLVDGYADLKCIQQILNDVDALEKK